MEFTSCETPGPPPAIGDPWEFPEQRPGFANPQEGTVMLDQMFENVRRATEFNIRTQQRLFKKWAGLWGVPASPKCAGDSIAKAQEQWTEFVTGMVRKQRETLEPHFKNS